jgi:hypothetical protein
VTEILALVALLLAVDIFGTEAASQKVAPKALANAITNQNWSQPSTTALLAGTPGSVT